MTEIEKINNLRAEMLKEGIDLYIIPMRNNLLNNEKSFEMFMQHCGSEHCTESVLSLIEIIQYKQEVYKVLSSQGKSHQVINDIELEELMRTDNEIDEIALPATNGNEIAESDDLHLPAINNNDQNELINSDNNINLDNDIGKEQFKQFNKETMNGMEWNGTEWFSYIYLFIF